MSTLDKRKDKTIEEPVIGKNIEKDNEIAKNKRKLGISKEKMQRRPITRKTKNK